MTALLLSLLYYLGVDVNNIIDDEIEKCFNDEEDE